jgi:vacuolar-type H+-ATPase subunit E/Vma4
MGLEVVVNEIIEEGRRQAARIEQEGLQEAKAILEEAKAKAQATLAEKDAQAARDAQRLRTQETARAEFEAKKQVLVARRALWDRLRAEALDALTGLDDAQRGRVLNTLVSQAAREIPAGTVHVRKQDAGLISAPAGLVVVGDLQAAGGLVVEDTAGSVSLDHRFESILADVWPTVLKEESGKLFG